MPRKYIAYTEAYSTTSPLPVGVTDRVQFAKDEAKRKLLEFAAKHHHHRIDGFVVLNDQPDLFSHGVGIITAKAWVKE